MKAPKSNLFALLLATALVGCTVNIHTRPDSDPGPEPAQSEPDVDQVDPTNHPDRAQPIPDPRRRTGDEPIVRREEPPTRDPETRTRNEPKTKDTGRREKEDTTVTQPETRTDPDPPDRPGVGKGRKESQETYPGKGNANGLDKQQEKDVEPANQGKAKGHDNEQTAKKDPGVTRQPTPDMRPDEAADNARAKNERAVSKQPEAKKDSVVKEQPAQDKKSDPKSDNAKAKDERAVSKQPEARKDSVVKEQPAQHKTSDPKPDNDKAKKDPTETKQQVVRNDPATARQQGNDAAPGRRSQTANAQKEQQESQPDKPDSKNDAPVSTGNGNPPARLGIQSKHLPSPGQCRVWIPGTPSEDQAEARDCGGIESSAPAGSWVLYRPEKDKKVVHVRQMDERRKGSVAHVWIYEASSGKYLGENSKN
jgi:hypothetical protein